MKSLASQGVRKVYQVRQYREFPFKMDSDPLIKEFETIQEARQGLDLARKFSLVGERFYLIDDPHQEVKATEEQENAWERVKKLCDL